MANDHFTETSSTGWFSRIGSSISGVFIGFILLLISVALLWWNEGRSVKTARGLTEGAQITVEAKADAVEAANEGKLVHVMGKVTIKSPAVDDLFAVTGPDLVKLRRLVEFFQWVEEKSETKRKKFGGGEETVTQYNYMKKWDSKEYNSADFKHPEGHENMKSKVQPATFLASDVKLGAYRLPDFLLNEWNDFKPHPLPSPKELPANIRDLGSVQGEWLVMSETPQAPVVGDVRVKYTAIKTGDASLLARQVQDTFEEFTTTQGTGIGRISSGVQSKDAMFAAAQAENTFTAWLLRVLGFVLMLVGTLSLFRPLKVLADVLPLAGSIVGAGTGFVALLLSAAGSLTIIALAWLWYRPLLGIALLAAAVGALYMIKKAFKGKAA